MSRPDASLQAPVGALAVRVEPAQVEDSIRAVARDLAELGVPAVPVVSGHVLAGLVTEADWRAWTPEGLRPYLDVAFECFGPERLMIGSDWPVCLVASSYSRTLDVVKNYLKDHMAETREAVLGGNARRFWRLKG